jgi:hypothetical protein
VAPDSVDIVDDLHRRGGLCCWVVVSPLSTAAALLETQRSERRRR